MKNKLNIYQVVDTYKKNVFKWEGEPRFIPDYLSIVVNNAETPVVYDMEYSSHYKREAIKFERAY